MTPHLQIEDAAMLPPAWCWGGHEWLPAGLEEMTEAGLVHTRTGCWPPLKPP